MVGFSWWSIMIQPVKITNQTNQSLWARGFGDYLKFIPWIPIIETSLVTKKLSILESKKTGSPKILEMMRHTWKLAPFPTTHLSGKKLKTIQQLLHKTVWWKPLQRSSLMWIGAAGSIGHSSTPEFPPLHPSARLLCYKTFPVLLANMTSDPPAAKGWVSCTAWTWLSYDLTELLLCDLVRISGVSPGSEREGLRPRHVSSDVSFRGSIGSSKRAMAVSVDSAQKVGSWNAHIIFSVGSTAISSALSNLEMKFYTIQVARKPMSPEN